MGGRANGNCEGRHEERKGEGWPRGGVGVYDTRCILRENRPALLSRLPLRTGEIDGDEKRKRERERGGTTPLYDTTRFPRYSLVSEANTPHPPDSWIQSNESPLPPSRPNLFSNLPAARYRLPNKLTECSALRLPPVSLSWFPSRIGSISVQTEPPPPSLNRDILRDPALFRPNYAHDYLPGGRPRSKSGEEEDFGKGTLLESDRISTRIDSRFNFLLSLFLRGTLDYLATTYDGTCDNVQRGPDLTQSEIPSDHLPRLPDRGLPASPPPRYI